MRVRGALPNDVLAIAAIQRACALETCSRDYSPHQIRAWLERQSDGELRERIEAGIVVVADDEGGFVRGYGARAGRRVLWLFVAPPEQGKGVGSALLRQMEHDARAEGLQELSATSTLTALDFYLKRGWTRGAERQFPAAGPSAMIVVEITRTL